MRGDTIIIPILQMKKWGSEDLKCKVGPNFYDRKEQISANCYEVKDYLAMTRVTSYVLQRKGNGVVGAVLCLIL